jgi:response regulator of citrate/malate metabolism
MTTTEELSVLVVDDDYRVAAVHVGFVERVPGFRIVGQAHTATEALNLSRSLSPDLVLMDVYLPDGDGIDVVQALVAEPDPPGIIVISAASDVATVRRSVQLGAVHYLVKPFSFASLAERLTAFRNAQEHITEWPEDATQEDINKIFDLLRPTPSASVPPELLRLAPTLKLVYDALAASDAGLSASEIAVMVGVSRGTAQRYLARLEQTNSIKLELKYGHAGRPEHRYRIKQN